MNRLLALALAFLCIHDPSRAQGVTLDAQGWTRVALSPDSRVVYVDPARPDDSGDGLSQGMAEKTIAAGMADLRDHYPDHLRLKSGATFPKGFGKWTKSGRSKAEPMVVETYPLVGARAMIRDGASATPLSFFAGSGAPARFEHVVFSGFDLEPVGRNGSENPRGIEFILPIDDVLFENVRVAGFQTDVVVMGQGSSDVRFRRCLILDAFGLGNTGHSNGMYVDGTSGLLMYQCLLDHNGFDGPAVTTGATTMRHDLYCQNGQGTATLVECIISQPSSHGCQLRSGGTIRSCLFYRCPIALQVGGGSEITENPDGVPATVRGNVILDGNNISPSEPRGWAMVLSNISGGLVAGNLAAHNTGSFKVGITLEPSGTFGIEDLTISGNTFYDWGGGIFDNGGQHIRNLVQQGNQWNQSASLYVDPTRTVPTNLLPTLRVMHAGNWDANFWPPKLCREAMKGYVLKAPASTTHGPP